MELDAGPGHVPEDILGANEVETTRVVDPVQLEDLTTIAAPLPRMHATIDVHVPEVDGELQVLRGRTEAA